MPETAIPQTPYVRARQEWDERFGGQIKSKNNWRLAAFIAMGTTFVCVTGMVAIGYRSNRAFVSVVTQEVTDAKQALVNPLGLYVTNLTWGEVVTTGGDAQTGNAQTVNGGNNK